MHNDGAVAHRLFGRPQFQEIRLQFIYTHGLRVVCALDEDSFSEQSIQFFRHHIDLTVVDANTCFDPVSSQLKEMRYCLD